MTFEEALAYALTLPGIEAGTYYGHPAVKVSANGRAFVFPGHEENSSFGLALDRDSSELLKETDPGTFWQTPHYAGWDAVLVRYDSSDPARVRQAVARGRDYAAAKPKPRPRKAK